MATKLGSLLISLGLDAGEFKSGLSQAERELAKTTKNFEKIGSRVQNLGKTLSIGVTAPLVALGVTATKAAAESRDAMAQVNAALKSMGPVAGKTEKDLAKLAKTLQFSSTFDDDEILRKVTANLLTFGKVSGDVFDRTQQAVVDLSTRLKMDLQSATILVGKALNDPKNGLAALGRTGAVSKEWVKDNKALIAGLVETGRTAEAQAIILAELERQYKGSAKAARDAVPGSDMINKWNDFQETVGEVLLKAFERIEPTLNRIADAFLNMSPAMQTTLVAAAGLAAALGPVLFVVGGLIKFAAPMLAFTKTLYTLAAAQTTLAASAGVVGAGLGSLLASLAPIALAVGVAYVAWKNWDDIAPRLTPIIGNLRDIGEFLGLIGPKAKEAGDKSSDATSDMEDLGEAAKTASAKFQSWADAFDEYNQRTAASARENGTTIQAGLRDLWGAFESFVTRLNGWGARFKAVLTEAVGIGANIVMGIARGIRQAPEAVWNALKGVLTNGIANAKAFLGIQSPSRVFMEIGAFIGDGLAIGIEKGKGKVDAATRKLTEAARKAAEEIRDLFARLFPEIEAANNYRRDMERIAGTGLSDDAKTNARIRLGREFTGTGGEIPITALNDNNALEVTKGMDDVLKSLELFKRRAGATTVSVAKSFKDMADATVQSLSNLANSIKGGGFLGILEAVIGLGLQLGSIGAFGSKIAGRINAPSIPGRALGGPISAGMPYMVGERGPELVVPRRNAHVIPNNALGGGKLHVSVAVENGNLRAFVRDESGQLLAESSPALMQGSAKVAQSQMAYRQTRRVA